MGELASGCAPTMICAQAGEVDSDGFDARHHQGLATRLQSEPASSAERTGISRFEVMTQADNRAARGLLGRLRPEARLACAQAVCECSSSIGGNEDVLASAP